jgi:hypothetical protein
MKGMTGDAELAAIVLAVGLVISALIVGVSLVVAAGRLKK